MMAIKTKKKIYLEYRYDRGDPWKVYDWTQVYSWANSQFDQMMRDHPGAEYRKITK
jgi:hypothetical protein